MRWGCDLFSSVSSLVYVGYQLWTDLSNRSEHEVMPVLSLGSEFTCWAYPFASTIYNAVGGCITCRRKLKRICSYSLLILSVFRPPVCCIRALFYYLGTRAKRSLGSTAGSVVCFAMSQIYALNSRAMAVTTTLRCFPRCNKRWYRRHNRSCAFHAMVLTQLGKPSCRVCISVEIRAVCR